MRGWARWGCTAQVKRRCQWGRRQSACLVATLASHWRPFWERTGTGMTRVLQLRLTHWQCPPGPPPHLTHTQVDPHTIEVDPGTLFQVGPTRSRPGGPAGPPAGARADPFPLTQPEYFFLPGPFLERSVKRCGPSRPAASLGHSMYHDPTLIPAGPVATGSAPTVYASRHDHGCEFVSPLAVPEAEPAP